MKGRGDVQNLSAMFFELRKRRAADVESSLQIDIDHGAKAVRRQLFSRTQKVAGRAVNDNVDLSEVFDSLCDGFFNIFGVANVSSHRECLATVLVDSIRGRL